MSIHLTAMIKSKAGMAKQMRVLLLDLVSGSLTEEACLQYDLHQSKDDEDLFILHEEWATEKELKAHNTKPHILKFKESSVGVINGEIIIYRTEKLA